MLTKDLKMFGFKVPTYPLFMVSGAICDVFQAGIDYVIYSVLDIWEDGRTTASWTLSYTLSIVLRHQSHRFLVFGDYADGYLVSLARTYMTYSSAIVVSMLANHTLVGYFDLSYRIAWIVTMLFTGIYNYFTLKATWKVKKEPLVLGDIDDEANVEMIAKPSTNRARSAKHRTTTEKVVSSDEEYFSDGSGGVASSHKV
jgi:putative flippase GtrA